MDEKVNKRGVSIAIWIILAIVLVASILLFFNINRIRDPIVTTAAEFSEESFIEKCVEQNVEDAVDIMLPQGGFIYSTNSVFFEDANITYLCQNRGNFHPCINQYPMYLNSMKLEIENYISPRVEICFDDLKEEVEKRKGEISYGEMNISVDFAPNRIYVLVDRDTTITKNEETRRYDDFKVEIINPLYDLALIAIEIASQEAKYCYFEHVGYMALYSRFYIEKEILSDSTKIYRITDKYSDKRLGIAIRGCGIPPGI
jgi:hypothetical protein